MRLNFKILFNLFLSVLTVFACSCSPRKGDPLVSVENQKIMLAFDGKTGALAAFRDLETTHDFLDQRVNPGSPWEIEFTSASGTEKRDIRHAAKFSFRKKDSQSLLLTWNNFEGPGNEKLKVTAEITLDPEKPMSFWKISLEGINGKQVSQVIYPRISGIRDDGDEELAVPVMMGQILKNPRAHLAALKGRVKKYEWGYPGLSLQCLALTNPDGCGFYAACTDTLVYLKNFSFTLDTMNTLVYRMHNFPSEDPALREYAPSYSGVVGSFTGSWFRAAEIYRDWGSLQRWCRESRLMNRQTPAWLDSTALWVWNRSKSGNVLVPASDLQRRLGLPVSVFWHWWHGCSYDDGFPEYLPPREGKESFLSAINAAHDKGIHAIVYMNQRLWGTATESWKKENASQWAVKNRNGELNTHVYNIFSGKPTAAMCIATSFWKDKYSSLCDSVVNAYHVDGVYMDQAVAGMRCYNHAHGHPVGAGNYWVDNFGKLTGQIRSLFPQKKMQVLAGEGCGEAWLPLLDILLTLEVSRERYAGISPWKVIPFFQAVYHQYGITYGNYSSLLIPPYDELWPGEFAPPKPLKLLDSSFKRQFLMEQARSFVWGLQPAIANYQDFLAAERNQETGYLLNLAKTRYRGLKYLLYGKFVEPPEINIPEKEFDISRLSIYAGRKAESVTTFKGKFPVVYTGAWQADDNTLGIALASIDDEPFPVKFSLAAEDYKLPHSGVIRVIDHDSTRQLGNYTEGKIHVDFELNPRGLCIVEIIPSR